MVACPVCDTPRTQGDACEVCGLPFPAAGRGEAPVPPAEGLEPTGYAPVLPPQEAMVELEPTAVGGVGEIAAPLVEGLEPTGLAGSGATPGAPGSFDPPAAPVEGLEPTAADPVPGDSAPPGPVVCRYCRTPASGPELLCARCGMRLPLVRPPRPKAAAVLKACSDCGTPSAGSQCPACGARLTAG
jgi:hypothetical protein